MTTAPLQISRHDVGPLEPWRNSLAGNALRLAGLLQRTPTSADGADLLECGRDDVALASLFPDQSQTRDRGIRLGAASAHAAALAQARQYGWIELTRPATPTRRFPAGSSDLSPDLSPGLWLSGWALALMARDKSALQTMGNEGTIQACQPLRGRGDAFWAPLFLALSQLSESPASYPALAASARTSLETPGARIVEPGYVEHLLSPLLDLGDLISRGSATGWDRAITESLAKHRLWYSDETRRYDRTGFLAFWILGLAALAHDRGLVTTVASDYLPLELVEGRIAPMSSDVTYIYPTRRLLRPDEARWFLDLEGFPRATRTHQIVESEGRLVARYSVAGAPGIPRARADFALAPDPGHTSDGDLEPALDLGELVLVADQMAERAGEQSLPPSEQRALLEEAADALDAAIARIPPGSKLASENSFWTARGQSAYRREPTRFSRSRLGAVADAWRRRAKESQPPGDDAAARASALEFIEIIRTQVAPVIETIARDLTGDVIRQLRPHDEDYGKVFSGEAVEVARDSYARVWSEPPDVTYPTAAQKELTIHVAPAGMFASDNELSRHFPGGYRSIAHLLNPHRVWVAWKYTEPGKPSGLAYNGLVWCDDHWAWFPKPYRALAKVVG